MGKFFIALVVQLMVLSSSCAAQEKRAPQVPGTPLNLSGKANSNNTIALRWSPIDSSAVIFDIWRDDGAWKKLGNSPAISYLDTTIGLERDRTYKYKVQ